jgi:hypothetical protein
MGLGARAQQIYLEALALAPDNPALHNNLCFSYYQAGNWSQAETCFRQTITRQPNNQAARNNLGLVLCRQGRQEEARRLWQEAEGEAIAAENLSKALAALGIAEETRYAQAIQPQAAGRLSSRHSPPGGSHGNDPVTATTRWRPLQAPAPSVNPAIETATRAPVPPPEAAADKLAATLPLKRLASDSRAGEIPAPQTVEVQAGPAAPPAQQPAPGLVAPDPPAQSLPPRREMAAAPPLSPPRDPVTPASPVQAASQPVQADQPNPEEAAGKTALAKPQGTPRSFITARELMETNIAILNGNGIHNLAHDTRSRLHLEGYNVMAINNFRDFGVNRTVIYYQPEAERVATSLTKKFFPGAELKAMPLRADSIDVKVVLGHDLRLQQQAAAPHTHVPPL